MKMINIIQQVIQMKKYNTKNTITINNRSKTIHKNKIPLNQVKNNINNKATSNKMNKHKNKYKKIKIQEEEEKIKILKNMKLHSKKFIKL